MTLYTEMINLGRAADRRAHMQPSLTRAGLQPILHPAFDHAAQDPQELHRLCRPEGPWGTFHTGNMACTISHMQVWQRFLETDATHCLVLEDDVFIHPDLGSWAADLSWWPDDADMVKIERWRANSLKVLLAPKAHHQGRAIKRLLSRHTGAAGYMLTRDAAAAFCAAAPYDLTIDQLLFNFNASATARRMTAYQVQPALVEQGNEPPDAPLYIGARKRPKGMALLRQKLKRLYYELAYPPGTLLKFITRRARLEKITFVAPPPFEEAAR